MSQVINDEFRNFADEILLYSFYETVKMTFGVPSAMIVERDSAVLRYKNKRAQYLNANQRDVCKYEDPSDPNYLTVKNALATAVEELLHLDQVSKSDRIRGEMKVVQAYLDVHELPDDDVDTALLELVNGSIIKRILRIGGTDSKAPLATRQIIHLNFIGSVPNLQLANLCWQVMW